MVKLFLCLAKHEARNIYIWKQTYRSIISWPQHYIPCNAEGFEPQLLSPWNIPLHLLNGTIWSTIISPVP